MKKESFAGRIKEGIYSSFYIMVKEFKEVFRDEGVLIFFFLVPLAYPLLYSFIYNNETVHQVEVVAVDDSKTSLSREFLRKADATAEVKIVARADDMEQAREMLRRKQAYGIIYIPAEFSRDIAEGKQTHISLYSDMSSLLFYKAMLLTATEVSLDMGKDIRLKNLPGGSARQQEVSATPIDYTSVTLFNPQSGFASFLIPAVLVLIIQQTLLLGIGMLAGTARDRNMFKDLIPVDKHYKGTLRVVFGKGLCYLVIYTVVSYYILRIVPAIFKLPQVGTFWDVSLFMLPYLFACIFFSMAISTLVRGRESPMLLFVFTSVPFLFLSGVSWPQAAVPDYWKIPAWLIPSTHGIQGFIKINTMGATLNEVRSEYQALWLLTGSYFLITFFLYRAQIHRHRAKVLYMHRTLRAKRISGQDDKSGAGQEK